MQIQITPVQNNSLTAFKASLPKKTGETDLNADGYHDFWDTFINICKKEGNSETLQKYLQELKKVEKDKILAFDKYNFENGTSLQTSYLLGLFNSQEALENARESDLCWEYGLKEAISIGPAYSRIIHSGKSKIIQNKGKMDSQFFLDILGKMIENLKANTEGNILTSKLRIK